ncbi:zinc ribbon domain containing 2 [Homo sapiens]|uniref:Zinc ribbon domain containing 2 n=1 Tax=Homo sapiens TaxID=9606 RepID=E9PK41_HUMAN|nr:zinc ribbon domain containing 2 [Homo sapiens]KAI4072292.1 zinc ribbon domain containing 2 [Homo sapiens]
MALNGAEVDDFSWEPPTEAETKVLQARRERQDRISRLMGDYLLRGYRMLGETRSSSKTNSGKSTAWLVRNSTQTWIKIIPL